MNNSKIVAFPKARDRVLYDYELEECAGCGVQIAEDMLFAEVVMTSQDEKVKKHIALCRDCERIANQSLNFN